MFIVIVLFSGDVEFVKMCVDDDHARNELADWCCENWQDEDESYEHMSTNDVIEWYFDTYEDYSYYRQPIVPAVTPFGEQAAPKGEDILLTPGMLAIVRHGLGQVQYGQARDLLFQHEELDPDGDGGQEAAKVVGEILEQFS